mmetsp:Transcript_21097/g.60192  ORF Transcript_21097/g.60192 Transcript_21097/m.60192 type:complete len:259 (-) Transcript_21097:507-1283(-)
MLEMVQQASFRMPFFGEDSNAKRHGRALLLMMNWVCKSLPVTMLPTVRSAGVWTAGDGFSSNSTKRLHTPASMTAWIFSFGPSLKYDSAQQASVKTSSSGEKMSCESVGRAGRTISNAGCGLPLQKLDSVHVAFRSMLSLEFWCSCCSSGCMAPACNTKSRHGGESPAILPRAHTACSLTSSFGLERMRTKIGTAPTSMTTLVWSDVPEAMFVNAQAASNCNAGLSSRCRNSTNRGTTPESMTCWIGGFFSMLSNRRN